MPTPCWLGCRAPTCTCMERSGFSHRGRHARRSACGSSRSSYPAVSPRTRRFSRDCPCRAPDALQVVDGACSGQVPASGHPQRPTWVKLGRTQWEQMFSGLHLESRHRPAQHTPAEMTQTEFLVARYIASARPNLLQRTYLRLWPRVPARASTSNQFPFTNHSKVDPADQIRTEHLGGADGGHRLSQRTDVRSERHDSAQHHGYRSDGGDLIGSEYAEHHNEQQCDAAGDCRLRNQNNLSASLGDLGKHLEPRFDP